MKITAMPLDQLMSFTVRCSSFVPPSLFLFFWRPAHFFAHFSLFAFKMKRIQDDGARVKKHRHSGRQTWKKAKITKIRLFSARSMVPMVMQQHSLCYDMAHQRPQIIFCILSLSLLSSCICLWHICRYYRYKFSAESE